MVTATGTAVAEADVVRAVAGLAIRDPAAVALALDELTRRYQDLVKRAAALRSYL